MVRNVLFLWAFSACASSPPKTSADVQDVATVVRELDVACAEYVKAHPDAVLQKTCADSYHALRTELLRVEAKGAP